MKTIIFFDLDGTIHDTQLNKVPSETIKLLEKLQALPNVYLGLATGRNISKTNIVAELLHLFTYKVYINGALATYNDQIIVDKALNREEIKKVIDNAINQNVIIGFVGKDEEYLTDINQNVKDNYQNFNIDNPKILNDAYNYMSVYQLWSFSFNKNIIKSLVEGTNLEPLFWETDGADIVRKEISKGFAIQNLLANEKNYQLISVGNGHNDISMFEISNISIVMGNATNEELIKKADYIAPHIGENQLYDFFKKIIFFDKDVL